MQKSRHLEGVIPVVQTPIFEDGSIDAEGLKRLIEFLIGKGVGGFWALGTGSEDMNLTFKKRLQVAEVVTKANAGRLPLVLGAGFFALEEILEFMGATKHLKFDAYHVMPYHPLLGLERMDWLYRHVADNAPKPLWMYTSANWCRPFPPEFVANLKDHPNIGGIKYSTSRTTDMIKVATLAEEDFQVITALAGQFYLCLALGAKGGTTSLASCLPEAVTEIYDLFRAGKHGEALAAQRRLVAFLDELPKGPKKQNFLGAAEEKYILSLRGICHPYTTSYYQDLTREEQAAVKAAVEKYGYLPVS